MKAADISDERVYEIVRATQRERPSIWGNVYALYDALPEFPPKVVHAKVRLMINKGRLHGCPCGCRGDLEIPDRILFERGWEKPEGVLLPGGGYDVRFEKLTTPPK